MCSRGRLCFYTILALLWLTGLHCRAGALFSGDDLVIFTLENGLRVIVREDNALPIVAMEIVVRSGSGTDIKTEGVAHALEHLVFQGSSRYPESQQAQIAIEMSGTVTNAITGRDATRYQAVVPALQLRSVLDIFADVLLQPILRESDCERERATITQEIAQWSASPLPTLINEGYLYSYPDHPYGRYPTGSTDALSSATCAAIRQYHSRWYRPNNMSIILVGNISPHHAREMVSQAFSFAPFTTLPELAGAARMETSAVHAKLSGDWPTSYQLIIFPAPAVSDLRGFLAMRVLLSLLGEGRSPLLPAYWSQTRSRVSAFGTEYLPTLQAGRLLLWLQSAPDEADGAYRTLMQCMADLGRTGVRNATVELAKHRLAAQFLLDNESYVQQAETLARYESTTGAETAGRYLTVLQEISIADVNAVIPGRYLARLTMGPK